MFSGISSIIGYFRKDDKPVIRENKTIDLTGLETYITKKNGGNKEIDLLKQFITPLDIGKYKLALEIKDKVSQKIKNPSVDYQDLRKDLFIYYKVNELLEQHDLYSRLEIPIKTELSNRKSLERLIKASEKQGVDKFAEIEVMALFKDIKRIYDRFSPPDELPKSIRTGAEYSWVYDGRSTLHPEINNLYQQVQLKCKAQEQEEQSISSSLEMKR